MATSFPFYHIGHFINQPRRPTDFAVTRFGTMEEPEVEDPHKHTFYELIWVVGGSTTQVIDYQEYETATNSLLLIAPGQLHHFENWRHLQGGSIFFTEDFLLAGNEVAREPELLDQFYRLPLYQFGEEDFGQATEIIRLLEAEYERPAADPAILRHLLQVLLLTVWRIGGRQTVLSAGSATQFRAFRRLVEERYADDWSAADYAAALAVTTHQLNRIARRVTGAAATEYLISRRLLEAKRYLTFTELPVGEIASRLNYFDGSYFAKLFRRKTGDSPREFRQKMSEKYRNLSDHS